MGVGFSFGPGILKFEVFSDWKLTSSPTNAKSIGLLELIKYEQAAKISDPKPAILETPDPKPDLLHVTEQVPSQTFQKLNGNINKRKYDSMRPQSSPQFHLIRFNPK